ncbi:MAG: hypothetical protein LBQ90_10185 [Synergistaceae bacterium]|jgi:hypothetical protein|nr:hypothetical protein [Synergistaceae bacterium]
MNGEMNTLTLLVAICDRNKAKKIMALFENRNALFNLSTLARGTASSKMLSCLGLGETGKTVLFSAMPDADARKVLAELNDTLDLKKPGHGIAFTLPLGAGRENREERDMTGNERGYNMIFVVVARGYTEEVMDAARAAKAAGGTIIHAKEFAVDAEKFFKVTIQPEKEIVLILADNDSRDAIVKNIIEKTGPHTNAGAIAVCLPVNAVEGLQTPGTPCVQCAPRPEGFTNPVEHTR